MSVAGQNGGINSIAAALEAMPTFPSQEDPRKRQRAAGAADDDGYTSADDGGPVDFKAYIDAAKDSLMASINAVQNQVQSQVASSVGSLATTIQRSCSGLALQ
eukprot:1083853-Pyramimonas_sp.AAC.1